MNAGSEGPTSSEGIPGAESHAFFPGHVDNVSLKVSLGDRPLALVDYELSQAMVSGVLIGLGDDPRRRVLSLGVQGSIAAASALSPVARVEMEMQKQDIRRSLTRDSEVQDFPGLNQSVEALHDFGNGCRPVPPVEV